MSTLSEQYAEALQFKFEERRLQSIKDGTAQVKFSRTQLFQVQRGQKFDRIVQVHEGDMYGGSVHAFVERSTGKLVKAAGWKAPAKRTNGELQSKFDLSTPSGFNAAVDAADPYGSYLYL